MPEGHLKRFPCCQINGYVKKNRDQKFFHQQSQTEERTCAHRWLQITAKYKAVLLRHINAHLGIKAFASSAVSGHKLAKHASSNLWSFFWSSKL